ncbi:methyl-accepting chemotaxis protein [Sneathiella aquimaris]|uniref:methyl-accepting chemotaxis protein n=1 Tax=Sneathiella aquimaris TaxID=2599305 RepID=UPI00146D32FD|nr:methyl-accepting chemotaxis protein [Sneathiella aquimaris]
MSVVSLRISKKLPLLIIASSLVLGLSLSFLGYFEGSSAVNAEVEKKLQVVLDARRSALENYLVSIREDLSITAANPHVVQAVKEFKAGWEKIEGNPAEQLQRAYITDNQHPVGEKEKLEFASDGSAYSAVHKKYHQWFRQALYTREYYDIFLFDLKGNLLYTVFKEADFATNLNSGKWKSSSLGNIYRNTLNKTNPDQQSFEDFAPYAPSNNAPASFIASPIFDNGKQVGVLAYQMSISRLNSLMQVSEGLGETGESYIVGQDFLMRSDSRFSETSTILTRSIKTAAAKDALAGKTGVMAGEDYRGVQVKSVYGPLEFMGTKWAVLAEIDETEYLEPIVEMRNVFMILCVVLLLIIGTVGVFFARNITTALASITSAMKKLAAGDLETIVPEQNRTDEIGDMSGALQVFKDGANEQRRLEKEAEEAARKAEERDRLDRERTEKQMEEERERERAEIAEKEARTEKITAIIQTFENRVSEVMGTLTGASTELQATANSLVETADGTMSLSTEVANASQEASSNVQTVASAAEELSASIGEISRQVGQATSVSEDAVDEARVTTDAVSDLAEAAKKISEVVSMISDIAGQTNLLALNATIEAARAGDAGKGFAVVASEVKSLATQTAKATEEITSQISGMQQATDGAVLAIEKIGGVIQTIRASTVTISSAVEEQNTATNEISRSVQEASSGTNEVSSKIGEVSAKSSETGSAASQVLAASGSLDRLAQDLKNDIEGFLNEIRVA